MSVNGKEKRNTGDCIRQLREEKGYDADTMAGLLLLTQKQLRAIESGRIPPDEMTLALAGYVFGVYPDALAAGKIITRKTDAEFMEQAKQILSYLEKIKENNSQFRKYDDTLKKEIAAMEKEKEPTQTQEKAKRTEIQYVPKL